MCTKILADLPFPYYCFGQFLTTIFSDNFDGPVVSKFGDYRNSDGISSEGKSSDYFKKKISVSANSVSIFWALKYIESKLSD